MRVRTVLMVKYTNDIDVDREESSDPKYFSSHLDRMGLARQGIRRFPGVVLVFVIMAATIA